ncbi:hypothetical protein QYF36_025946 [Acer negundo]|nr:hypothetical protein QYF36_025946 [Acer negundo]
MHVSYGRNGKNIGVVPAWKNSNNKNNFGRAGTGRKYGNGSPLIRAGTFGNSKDLGNTSVDLSKKIRDNANNGNNSDFNSLPQLFLILDDFMVVDLLRDVSDKEVKVGFFGLRRLKALGPDGIPNQWEVCSKDLINFVRASFRDGAFSVDLNQTLIALMPKVPSPIDMSQLRPISLYNISYKVISKVIIHRLKNLIPEIVTPNQVAFILVNKSNITLWLLRSSSINSKL